MNQFISKFLLFLIVICFTQQNSTHGNLNSDSPTSTLNSLYPIEIEDPHHRHYEVLAPILTVWVNEGKDKVQDFWEFIETNRAELQSRFPKVYNPDYNMFWMDSYQRAAFEGMFEMVDGKISISNTFSGRFISGKWLFVLFEGHFYIAKEIKHQLHHVSFIKGQPVESAGDFTIKNGFLDSISFSSGHYKPQYTHALQCIQKLMDQGLDLSSISSISYTLVEKGIRVKKTVSFEQFMLDAR